MYLKLGKIKIHITFAFAAFTAFAANSASGEFLMLVFVSALLHECVHLCFLLGYGCRELRLTLQPGGAGIRCSGMELLDVRQNVLALLSAPAANLLLAAMLYAAAGFFSAEKLFSAAQCNLCLGAVNLLPLSFSDGGRTLCAVLAEKRGKKTAARVCRCAEYVSLLLLLAGTVAAAVCRKPWSGAAVFTGYCFVFALGKLLKKEK